MRISQRLKHVNPSLTLEISARAQQYKADGKDVIGLAAGEPDFSPPPIVDSSASEAIAAGLGRYTAVAGLPDLQRSAAKSISDLNQFEYAPNEIVVSSGAKQSIFNALYVVADPGDEILILSPYWTSYPEMCRALALEPIIVPCKSDFSIDATVLASHITDRTRAIIINTPSNPSGRVMSRDELLAIGEVIKGKEIWAICDDIYARLVFPGHEFMNLPMVVPELRDQSLVIYGMSKTYCMTGWRIGFVAGPADIVSKIATVQSHSTSCANTIAQLAASKALEFTDDAFIQNMVDAYEERSRFVLGFLDDIGDITCHAPQAAFYALPNVSAWFGSRYGDRQINTALDLCDVLIDEALVAVVPGEAFGAPETIRISYATSMEELQRAAARLTKFFGSLQR
ncbi:MAG: aspartate aminotransferase [Planctomycetota bacterium]|jgi:aspartate aminotransferase